MSTALYSRGSDLFNIDKFLAYYTDRHCATTKGSEQQPTSCSASPLRQSLLPLPLVLDIKAALATVPESVNSALTVATPLNVDASLQSQRYFDALANSRWTDSLLADREMLFGSAKSLYGWRLDRKVSERAHFSPHQSYTTSIYECSQTRGRKRGPKAIMKIYMQIPYYCNQSAQMQRRPAKVPQNIENEITALKHMSRVKEQTVVPQLLATKRKIQTSEMWVPGGFLTCIVTQQYPGTVLKPTEFWQFSAATRDEIRMSFRENLETLWRSGVMPRNCDMRRLAWDQATKTCYFISLDGADIVTHPLRWWDYEYYRWGLSKTSFASWETSPFAKLSVPADEFEKKIRLAWERS